MHSLIEDLNWRYATKKYDQSKKISPENIEFIKRALQLVPTSYGLQPLKYLFIESPEIREKLFEHSFNQRSIIEASHLLVVCSYVKVENELVDSYIQNMASIRALELEKINGFGDFIKRSMQNMSQHEQANWNAHQAYIALGVLMQTCAQLRIDSTPMEGFVSDKYNEILDLSPKHLNATLVVPMGYRHDEDVNQSLKKVRRPFEELFESR